jgi:hypothetical protein
MSSRYPRVFRGNDPAEETAIRLAERQLGISFPADYVSFLLAMDGGLGWIGEMYLRLFRAGELVQANLDYGVREFAPGALYFGSDCGGNALAFDTRLESFAVVEIPFVGYGWKYADFTAANFSE